MLTIEQRRKSDRKRRERWRQKKLSQGCKQIQLMIAPEAQAVLKREKSRTGEPFVQIIHRAILSLDNVLPSASFKSKAKTIIPETNRTRISESDRTKPDSKISRPKNSGQESQLKLF